MADGKLLYMAVPRLRSEKPFLALDLNRLGPGTRPRAAASIQGSAAAGVPVGLAGMARIDLIVCGSVAVNRAGVRLGKGGGFSDLEFALAREAGIVGPWTTIATTVHPIQVWDDDLPETAHDFRVDLIATPEGVYDVPPPEGGRIRPRGILWDHLDDAKIASIPALAQLHRHPTKRTPG